MSTESINSSIVGAGVIVCVQGRKAYPILHEDVFKSIALVLSLDDTSGVHHSCIGRPVPMHNDPRRDAAVDALQVL